MARWPSFFEIGIGGNPDAQCCALHAFIIEETLLVTLCKLASSVKCLTRSAVETPRPWKHLTSLLPQRRQEQNLLPHCQPWQRNVVLPVRKHHGRVKPPCRRLDSIDADE